MLNHGSITWGKSSRSIPIPLRTLELTFRETIKKAEDIRSGAIKRVVCVVLRGGEQERRQEICEGLNEGGISVDVAQLL